jgi:transcriptional regulator with XRE-family HTH domain
MMYFTSLSVYEISLILLHIWTDRVITSFQMRAARALLGIDQKTLAELAGVSLPTIQRMEASAGNVRGVVESLTRVVEALDRAGVALIGEHARSDEGGRGVRLKEPGPPRRI